MYPFSQTKLQEFLGRSDVDRHLDADEATVLGASLHAANLSDGIKLNRKLGMIDGSMYGFMMDLDGPGLVKDETTSQSLVSRLKKLPIKVYLINSSELFCMDSTGGIFDPFTYELVDVGYFLSKKSQI